MVNSFIEEHNRLLSLWEQVKDYYTLSDKGELSESEKLMLSICKRAMTDNGIYTRADFDQLKERTGMINRKISNMSNRAVSPSTNTKPPTAFTLREV
ncbi:hypothetical protein [Ruminococcus albus]|uniref:Uncharacterized protein n=1 Tax=Ruminococcus albus TaxID=1264 RepID=A0A1I1D2U5_RUMAL|nr:hypothetical protein [Ruminococcus albus]SFB67428.1 hypothetical protein SAMN02910406_00178 [Ruminococcus albus]